jgi:uncharacterized protein YbjT (DUF2867 family)
MKVIVFGATGMVGQGVLRECLLDDRVEKVLVIGRAPVHQSAPKLEQAVVPELFDLSSVADRMAGFDAVFYCLGVSSVGMKEPEYTRITKDLTLSIADVVQAQCGSGVRFIYVSGGSTDSTEHGRVMWARVKGATENALLAQFPYAVMFRPGFIQPLHGVRSKTAWVDRIYRVTAPLAPTLRKLAPGYATTTEQIGRAMINVAALPPQSLRENRIYENRALGESTL